MSKKAVLDFIDDNKQPMLNLWEQVVNIESGPDQKKGTDAILMLLKKILEDEGFHTRMVSYDKAGNTLIAEFGNQILSKPIAFIGHVDTVFSKGFLLNHPFRLEDGKAYGPGILDMKGGIVSTIYVLKALRSIHYDKHPLKVIIVGDEETAHIHSACKELLVNELKGCMCAFNTETGNLENQLAIGRAGGAAYELEVEGVASHTGMDWQSGRNAIIELSRKMLEIDAASCFEEGYTFNVTLVEGGAAVNTCPDYAKATIGVRYQTKSQQELTNQKLKEIASRSYIQGTTSILTYKGGFDPMEVTEASKDLFEIIRKSAKEIGTQQPGSFFSQGSSDSSYAVAAGVPTVCALGPQGEGNHTPDEYAVVDSIFTRSKLIAATILNL
ncbi:M20 family metallopeptidase [Alteribacillus bidgolensis]|uniref:Glutamate carboxypeptidase n=1 Tax=Alteribacillus bidgolensis TaxID=930129 RepID=A0A1G8PAP6_9BACI|nr:M20 family metallopeptidase [Alteribacillus bidgolensis]SDI89467.1 glutamate carboxypeptidase [Alteribacillus bidgolensis]